MARIASSIATTARRSINARAFSTTGATKGPRTSLRSTHTAHPTPSEPSLSDKFSLAALNGGKNPFDVASQRLLNVPRPAASTRATSTVATAPRCAATKPNDMRDVYSLDYLLGKQPAGHEQATRQKEEPV
ncbi:hypothetical protein PINS_up005749 [Pythium insidiosum]|nr:hypothetical protein PINS_up005749 [Pythium insidiosum]